jgi:hypothetical protein
MKERLSLLQEVDPYTGRYFSQSWIQRQVLRLTDDQIREMQTEIDEEKSMGMGLPVGVTNSVAQQSMMQQVQADPEQGGGGQDVEESAGVFTKLKQIL